MLTGKLGLTTLVIAMSLASASNASILGDTVHAEWDYPSIGTVWENYSTAVVNGTVEFSAVDSADMNAKFSANTLTLTTLAVNILGPASFNGFVATDLTNAFTSASLDPSTIFAGVTAGDISVVGGVLEVNLQGLNYVAGETIVVDLSNNNVPEPVSLALLGVGLAGLGVVRRKAR